MKPTCLLACVLLACAHSAGAARNILLVIADDYGIDSSSLYNTNAAASLPPTPNINALKNSGVLFRYAYANPVCSPTRACLTTGRHSFRTGVGEQITSMSDPTLTVSEFTLAEAFAANGVLGYQLALIGKWHLHPGVNSPGNVGGWPHFSGIINGAVMPSYTSWTKTVNGSQSTVTNYATTEIADDAITWITAQGTQPWFLCLAFNAPHTPFHKPPTNLITAPYTSLSGTQANINANPRPYYEAMVQAMDTELGRVLSAVSLANTDIIFLGDNGTPANVIQPPYSSARAKATLYEGGTRVPLIIAGPDVTAPSRESAAPVHAVDLFATILELAGINASTTLPAGRSYDTRSLVPILQNTTETTARYALSELFGDGVSAGTGGRTLCDGHYKLLCFDDGRRELYDIQADAAESIDLLGGTLTTAQQQAFSQLTFQLTTYQETLASPIVISQGYAGGQFTLTVQRDTTMTYELWRGSDLADTGWTPVADAVVSTGASTVTLTDPAPPGSRQFYRVLATKL